jgi:hypothetical protein
MKVTRFEDLEIWKLTRELYKFVYKITSEEPFCRDFRFRDQIMKTYLKRQIRLREKQTH